MGPTWVLSAPDGPHISPINLAMRDILTCLCLFHVEIVVLDRFMLIILHPSFFRINSLGHGAVVPWGVFVTCKSFSTFLSLWGNQPITNALSSRGNSNMSCKQPPEGQGGRRGLWGSHNIRFFHGICETYTSQSLHGTGWMYGQRIYAGELDEKLKS